MKMLNSIHPITKYYLKAQKTPGKEGESQLCIEKELNFLLISETEHCNTLNLQKYLQFTSNMMSLAWAVLTRTLEPAFIWG